MPKLFIMSERCTGCNSCSLACSFVHEGYCSLVRSRILIDRDEERAIYKPRVCIQCEEVPCIEACPAGALAQDESTGAIKWDGERCVHCHLCEEACPYGGIHFVEGDKLLICDLCGGDPLCAKICKFPGAISYEGG
jgi:Fe-S-cluster-containing hydrogenase component 2